MSDSTTHLEQLTAQQLGKAETINALFDAHSPAATFGRRSTSTALTWAYNGGKILVDGVVTSVANGTVALTANSTNYVEANRAGTVSANTTGFTAGSIPLYQIVTGASSVSSYTDKRISIFPTFGHLVLPVGSPEGNWTLTAEQAMSRIIQLTGPLTAQRDLIVPSVPQLYVVVASTTGFGVRVINPGSPQASVPIAVGSTAIVRSSGAGVFRVTADA